MYFLNIGAPIVISWPHFYDGDKSYADQSIGLQPEKDRHETFIVLEPVRISERMPAYYCLLFI